MALLLKELNMERRCLINSGLKKSTVKLRKNQWQAVTKVLYNLVWYKKNQQKFGTKRQSGYSLLVERILISMPTF